MGVFESHGQSQFNLLGSENYSLRYSETDAPLTDIVPVPCAIFYGTGEI